MDQSRPVQDCEGRISTSDEDILESTLNPSMATLTSSTPQNKQTKKLDIRNSLSDSFSKRREISSLISSDEDSFGEESKVWVSKYHMPKVKASNIPDSYTSCSSTVNPSTSNSNQVISSSDFEKEDNDKTDPGTFSKTELESPSNSSDSSSSMIRATRKTKFVLISSDDSSEEEKLTLKDENNKISTDSKKVLHISIDESSSEDRFKDLSIGGDVSMNSLEKMSDTELRSNISCDKDDLKRETINNYRESQLKEERKRLEMEILDVQSQVNSIKIAVNSFLPDQLPDGGLKLRRSLEKKGSQIMEIKERISFLDSQLPSSETPSISPKKKELSFINNLPTASMNLSELGKKALMTHNVQSALTLETLEKLHKSLETQPKFFSIEPEKGLKIPLLPHQKHALGWAMWRESQKPSGGILADDMGLGKTLTMISLILHSKNQEENKKENSLEERNCGSTLVIAPSSVMGQWENEIKSKLKVGALSYTLYHGAGRKKMKRISSFDVVITTYPIVLREEDDNPLLKTRWRRIILDEGHIIRNSKSKTSKIIFQIGAESRWSLTGTPVQNKEFDLYSQLKFLRCKPFDDLAIWKKWVDNKDPAGTKRLSCILEALLLRRTKEGIQSEGGLQTLKSKTVRIIKVKLDKEEYDIYQKVAQLSKSLLAKLIYQKAEKENLLAGDIPSFKRMPVEENPFKANSELNRLYKELMSMPNVKTHEILVLLLRLRQICCHPSLAESILSSEELNHNGIDENVAINTEIVERITRMSLEPSQTNKSKQSPEKKLSSKLKAVVECVVEILSTSEDKIILVSQWTTVLDMMKYFLKELDFKTLQLDGRVPVADRPPIINKFNERMDSPKILLLSLTAGGTGLNLIGANHLLLIDAHWNPQVEAQASDRIYRVGQKKEVTIYKFICEDTIEENILLVQEEKLKLAKDVLAGSFKNTAAKLSLVDLKMLFNMR